MIHICPVLDSQAKPWNLIIQSLCSLEWGSQGELSGGLWWRRNIKPPVCLFDGGTMGEQCGSRRPALWSTFGIPRIQSNGGHVSHTLRSNKSGDLKGRASLRLALLLPLHCSTFSHALKPFLTTTKWFQRDVVGRAFFFSTSRTTQ